MAKCIHGIEESWCTRCTPGKTAPVKTQAQQTEPRTHEKTAGTNYVVVKTARRIDPRRLSFASLTQYTKVVHIDGPPFVWAVAEIIKRAPNVEIIEVTPKMFWRLTSNHRNLCKEKGVRLEQRYYKPEYTWEAKERIQPTYYES